MNRYYLAIDGGGTKTDAVLFTTNGTIVQRIIGGGTNPNNTTSDELIGHFQSLFSKLLQGLDINNISGCFAGLSGSDHPKLTNKLAQCIRRSCPVKILKLIVGNDAMNALWSGTDGKYGMVVIAGTGSIAYGILKSGKNFRVGGWGYLFGDEGSGYYIGNQAIRHAMKTFDGRESKTQLTDILNNYFCVESISDIIPVVYGSSKNVIAGIVPFIEKAGLNGDQLAERILIEAAQQLILLIQSGLRHFNYPVEIVLTGGIWNSKIIRNYVCQNLKENFVFPEVPPVYGSVCKCVMEWDKDRSSLLLPRLKTQLISLK